MDRIQRMGGRLPRFYRCWQEDSMISVSLRAMARELDQGENRLEAMMKSHWVDAAEGNDLEKLASLLGVARFPGEGGPQFRRRLKTAVEEYKGGGTVSSILEAVRRLVNAGVDDVRILENPEHTGSAEFTVRAGATWSLGSESIADAQPIITIRVEEGGKVRDPQITNLDTGESIMYNGTLGSQQKLVLEQGKATIDGMDVSERVSSKRIPLLLRKGSTWRYAESLEKMVGVFDAAKFDEHTFDLGVPPAKISFEWKRYAPATFEVHIRSKGLVESKVPTAHVENVVNSMKAVGVAATVKTFR